MRAKKRLLYSRLVCGTQKSAKKLEKDAWLFVFIVAEYGHAMPMSAHLLNLDKERIQEMCRYLANKTVRVCCD